MSSDSAISDSFAFRSWAERESNNPVACQSNAKTNFCSIAGDPDGSFQAMEITMPGDGFPLEEVTLGHREVPGRSTLGVLPKKEDLLTL